MAKYKVHPKAAIFPMMSEEALLDLATSIKDHGLFYPIMLGKWQDEETGKEITGIIDGRNREKACEIADVKPGYTNFTGKDITAFIAASNIDRREMTQSQKAMAYAMLYPKAEHGGDRLSEQVSPGNLLDVSKPTLSRARKVLDKNPTLAQEVLNGTLMLHKAVEKVDADIKKADKENADKLWLEANSAELYEEFQKDRITLEDAKKKAEKIIKVKEQEEQARIDQMKSRYRETFKYLKEKLETLGQLSEGAHTGIPQWFDKIENEKDNIDPDLVYQEFKRIFPKGREEFRSLVNSFEPVRQIISTIDQTLAEYERRKQAEALTEQSKTPTVTRIGPRAID